MEKPSHSWDDVDHKRYFGTASWIGQRVEVISQKNRGEVGVIRRSGHGFYAVELDNNRGMLMKRAGELELCGAVGVEDQKLWKAATILLCISETTKQKRHKADKKRLLLSQQQQQQQQVNPAVGVV